MSEKKARLQRLRWDCEMKLVSRCYKAESEAEKAGLEFTCTCPNPDNWTEEQCIEFLEEDDER